MQIENEHLKWLTKINKQINIISTSLLMILMHSVKKGLSDLTQIVVPKCLCERILIVSHEDMTGHLGSKKT